MSNQLDLLAAGLLSHGFKELPPEGEWRHFGQRLGREDRWLKESDLSIWIGAFPPAGVGPPVRVENSLPSLSNLLVPLKDQLGNESSYHRLLMKCGEKYIQCREAERKRKLERAQGDLELPEADEIAAELRMWEVEKALREEV